VKNNVLATWRQTLAGGQGVSHPFAQRGREVAHAYDDSKTLEFSNIFSRSRNSKTWSNTECDPTCFFFVLHSAAVVGSVGPL